MTGNWRRIGLLCGGAAALALGLTLLRGGPVHGQQSNVPAAAEEALPAASGGDADSEPPPMPRGKERKALIVGQEVLLKPDGSWDFKAVAKQEKLDAVSELGERIQLQETRRDDGTIQRTWQRLGHGGGPLQVLVSRALTAQVVAGSAPYCMPVVQIRNLTDLGIKRIIVEIQFSDAERHMSSSSFMLGPLDDGEQDEKVGAPLFVHDCRGLTGTLHVPYCIHENGVRCEHEVRASPLGLIPLHLAPKPDLEDGAFEQER